MSWNTKILGGISTLRFTKIDELIRSDHPYLAPEDNCFFLGEYTARAGFSFSETNQLIANFKKSLTKKDLPEWRYKDEAIREIANKFRAAFPEDFLTTVTLVPIPPSKAKDDPLYDDRVLRVLEILGFGLDVDIRELILQHESTDPVHESEERPSPTTLLQNYHLDVTIADPPPKAVALFDDLITAGAHFKAAQSVIAVQYPDMPIFGIFVARRVPQ